MQKIKKWGNVCSENMGQKKTYRSLNASWYVGEMINVKNRTKTGGVIAPPAAKAHKERGATTPPLLERKCEESH